MSELASGHLETKDSRLGDGWKSSWDKLGFTDGDARSSKKVTSERRKSGGSEENNNNNNNSYADHGE